MPEVLSPPAPIAAEPPAVAAAAPATQVPTAHFRWTVDRFERAIATGVFDADDKVELIEGVLCLRMSINPPHAFTTN